MRLGSCSSRTLYVDLNGRFQNIFIQESKNFLWASQKKVSYKRLQDLNARTWRGGVQQDLHKIFSEGPVRSWPRGSHQDLFKSFSQGPAQDRAKASERMPLGAPQKLHARTPKRSSRDRHKRNCCCWRGSYTWYKNLPRSLPWELSYKHL